MIINEKERVSLKNIENKLAASIRSENKSWKISYELVREVETDRLWAIAGYKSFSEWVRHLAETYSISEISVWKIKSAGDTYAKYEKSKKEKGADVTPFSDNKLAIDTIISLNRMSHGDQEKTNALIEYAQKHELSRKTIQAAWMETKKKMEAAGIDAVKRNGYETYQPLPASIDALKILEATVYPKTGTDIASDQDILIIVHKYLGATVYRSVLESILAGYID